LILLENVGLAKIRQAVSRCDRPHCKNKKNPTRFAPVGFQIHPYGKAGGDEMNYIKLNSPRPLSVCDARYKFLVWF